MPRAKKTDASVTEKWEIRRGGRTWLASPAENCGYKDDTLKSLTKNGFSLYKNGVCVQKGARRN